MTWQRKIGLILAGYSAAFVLALIGTDIASARWPPDEADGGMAAFADLMTFLELFGVFALAPTAAALWLIRGRPATWTLLSVAAILGAAVAPAAAVLQRLSALNFGLPPGMAVAAAGSAAPTPAGGEVLTMLTDLALIASVAASPVLTVGFLGFALIAPTRRARIMMATAGVVEGATAAYAFLCLVVLQRWLV